MLDAKASNSQGLRPNASMMYANFRSKKEYSTLTPIATYSVKKRLSMNDLVPQPAVGCLLRTTNLAINLRAPF